MSQYNEQDAQENPMDPVTPIHEPEPHTEPLAPRTLPTPEPMELAEPGLYRYLGEVTEHRVLGRLEPGEMDFRDVTHPEALMAIRELLEADPPILEAV